VQTPASFGGRFKVEVRTESEAVGIDTDKKQVMTEQAARIAATARGTYRRL
jgi:hypothetical protein